jgi:xanthine dehydrogenase accessory factor
MEGDVILHAHRLFDSGRPEILTFHLNEDDAEAGLICGGTLDVFLEPVTREHLPLIEQLKSIRDNGEDCILATFLPSSGESGWKKILPDTDDAARTLSMLVPPVMKDADELLRRLRHRREPQRLRIENAELILEPLAGYPSLILFGGGHVSKYISRIAHLAGFRVTVADDREKYTGPQRFPDAVGTQVIDFSDAFRDLTVTPSTYLVIVTRGHRFDEIVLQQALNTPAAYIGLIGSRRKILTTFGHLREKGVSDTALARVSGPVGIDIGAVTAEEIAVSIVAECIHARRNTGRPPGHMSDFIRAHSGQ